MTEEIKPLFEKITCKVGTSEVVEKINSTIQSLNSLLFQASGMGVLVMIECHQEDTIGRLSYYKIYSDAYLKLTALK